MNLKSRKNILALLSIPYLPKNFYNHDEFSKSEVTSLKIALPSFVMTTPPMGSINICKTKVT